MHNQMMFALIIISFLFILSCESGFLFCNGTSNSTSSWDIFLCGLRSALNFLNFLNTTAQSVKLLLDG
ncbi:unnamed protein product [Schistosoma margrebowiei]|uniref:Uncharacterized protein n=1 Tax=Schistosoma margrebowiei TaxID=48269 RepID=A0AA85AG31_9TREM|nr:unnamed protein product [Schistosoma margrebowiei]